MQFQDLFISYSHKDQAIAETLASTLRQLGWTVWKDQRLTTGNDFTKEIETQLEHAKLLVVLWSSSSVESDWVKKEAGIGVSRGIYFPVLVEHTILPEAYQPFHASTLYQWKGDINNPAFGYLCMQLDQRVPCSHADGKTIIEKAKRRQEFYLEAASPWDDLSHQSGSREDIPWPYWMIRYIVADNQEAMEDLVWSVGGSPPYGNVPYEEAEDVYNLIESFRGPGKAQEIRYANVEKHILHKPLALKALEAFRLYDNVASNAEEYTYADLRIGRDEAVGVVEEPLTSYYRLLKSGLKYREGFMDEAYQLAAESLEPLKRFAENDPAFDNRYCQALTNTAIFATLNGDLPLARTCAASLKERKASKMLDNFEDLLLNKPVYSKTVKELLDKAWEYFDKSLPHYAIEWFVEAEKLARATRQLHELPGIFGDMAVCYRRMGNEQASIRTNRKAIEASQQAKDTLGVYRWSQNLSGILMRAKMHEAAFPYLRISLYAAAMLNDAEAIKLSASALYEYKFHSYAPETDITDMYSAALDIVKTNHPKDATRDSVKVLSDFVKGKITFATQ